MNKSVNKIDIIEPWFNPVLAFLYKCGTWYVCTTVLEFECTLNILTHEWSIGGKFRLKEKQRKLKNDQKQL